MATPDYGMMLQQMTEEQRKEKERIDILAAQMKPLAQTQAGQTALQDKMADQDEDKVVRAAAAQSISGFDVSIGKHGELSFSAAPMQDIGQSAASDFEQGRVQDKVTAGKQNTFTDNFNQTYNAIASETDPTKIASLNADLQSNVASLVNAKEASIRTRLSQSLGIATLEQQIAQAEQLDRQAYAQAGLSYAGPTDETQELMRQKTQATNQMYALAQDELAKDPEIAAMTSRMKALDTLVQQKSSIAGKNLAGAVDNQGASIAPERIKGIALAMGVQGEAAEKEIAERVSMGSAQHLKAEEIAAASPEILLAKATAGGVEGQMADRVLTAKLGTPDDAKLLKQYMNEFDPAKLPEKERALYMPSAMSATASPTMQAQEAQLIQQRKAQYAIKKFNELRATKFQEGASNIGQPGGWDMPTDPALQELPAIVKDIKAADPQASITADTLIGRMDWNQETKAVKIKALSNYLYAQAQKDPNNAALGGITGYRNTQEIEQMVQAKVIANESSGLKDAFLNLTGVGAIYTGVKGTIDNASKILDYTTPALLKRGYDYATGDKK